MQVGVQAEKQVIEMTGTSWQELKWQELSCMRTAMGQNLWPILRVATRGQSRRFGLSLENSPAHHFIIKIPQTWSVCLFKYRLNRHDGFKWIHNFYLSYSEKMSQESELQLAPPVIFTQMTITNDCHNLRAASQVINNQQPARISANEKIIIAGPW